ncbi:MAG TPA: DUF2089 domain-containing protein [Candidatus Limnocylindria bacterium]|nr:DUF2089 domain-containing protein [Candidatus Limnocylindria bacterium]
MPRDVISTCPVCERELLISRLHCRNCGTALEGEFGVGRFGRLSREQLALLESFLRARGNLKEMERELGISYPTVRGRVDALVRVLGLGDGPALDDAPVPAAEDEPAVEPAAADSGPASERAAERRQVLERLSRGEIDATAAADQLRRLTDA